MAQHDYSIDNQAGAAFRNDLNNALSAIATNNSGATAPGTTFAYQWHIDTDAPATLYIRNGANSAYIEVGDATLDNLGLKKTRRATAQASTSGTTIDFTGIPSWANKITMLLNGVSTNGTGKVIVRLGTASGFVATGYNSNANTMGITSSVYSTTGFLLEAGANSDFVRSGIVDMYRINGNNWVYTSTIKQADPSGTTTHSNDNAAGNSDTLASVLTQVRLTTDTGSTFDAGTVNIVYES